MYGVTRSARSWPMAACATAATASACATAGHRASASLNSGERGAGDFAYSRLAMRVVLPAGGGSAILHAVAWMRFVVGALFMGHFHIRIDLRGRHALVTEEFLDGDQIDAVLQKM